MGIVRAHDARMQRKESSLTVKVAKKITGGLSRPSKMPCPTFNLPASACRIGSILRQTKGSTCARCYAADTPQHASLRSRELGRGSVTNYLWPTVRAAMARRLASLSHPDWVEAIVVLINQAGDQYFRWHDSGDLQAVEHLARIAQVCRLTPSVKHWLPTREHDIVREFLTRHGEFPDNLTVRLSAAMVGQRGPDWWKFTSTVSADIGRACPAAQNGNKCGSCRACWDKRVMNIDYHAH